MDESDIQSDPVLPEGINKLIKKDEALYNSERHFMIKPSKASIVDREKMKKGGNKNQKSSVGIEDEDNDYSGGPIRNRRISSDDSIENTLNEMASNTFNPNLFKEVISA
jgi:hypothetical protein